MAYSLRVRRRSVGSKMSKRKSLKRSLRKRASKSKRRTSRRTPKSRKSVKRVRGGSVELKGQATSTSRYMRDDDRRERVQLKKLQNSADRRAESYRYEVSMGGYDAVKQQVEEELMTMQKRLESRLQLLKDLQTNPSSLDVTSQEEYAEAFEDLTSQANRIKKKIELYVKANKRYLPTYSMDI